LRIERLIPETAYEASEEKGIISAEMQKPL